MSGVIRIHRGAIASGRVRIEEKSGFFSRQKSGFLGSMRMSSANVGKSLSISPSSLDVRQLSCIRGQRTRIQWIQFTGHNAVITL